MRVHALIIILSFLFAFTGRSTTAAKPACDHVRIAIKKTPRTISCGKNFSRGQKFRETKIYRKKRAIGSKITPVAPKVSTRRTGYRILHKNPLLNVYLCSRVLTDNKGPPAA